MVYLVLLLSIILFQILSGKNIYLHIESKMIVVSTKRLTAILTAIELIFVTIFRKKTVGADLSMYTRLFEAINKYSWRSLLDSKFEPGYMFFSKLVRCVSDNAQVFIVVTGMITVGFYLLEIFRKSYNPLLMMYLSLTYGFFFFQYSMIRQVIAMTLFMIAVDKLGKKKWLEYIIIVLVASTFHASVSVCLPLVFIVFFPWTDHTLNLIWMVEIIASVTLRGILEIIVRYIPRYAYILSENTSYKVGYMARIAIICGLYLASVFFCKVGWQGNKMFIKKEDDKKSNFVLILGSIGMMLMPMINYFESAQRMTYYFIPYVFWCVDLAVNRSKWMKRMLPAIYILLGIYYLLCFTGFTSVHDAFGTNNYLFFWQ